MKLVLTVLCILGGVIGALLALILLTALFLWIASLFISKKKEYTTDSPFYRGIIMFATSVCMVVCRIKLTGEGLDRLPSGTRYLVVANHRSRFDPIVTWHVLKPEKIAYISKRSNFSIPVFGKFVWRLGFLAIDRKHPKKAAETVEKAVKHLRSGTFSVGVYPEGTRNKDPGAGLLPFHNAMFKIAQEADVPIVVVRTDGTEKIHVNYPRRSTPVRVKVCGVIGPDEIRGVKTAEIGEKVRKMINDNAPSALEIVP